jgi:hypothetical protein
MPGILGLYDTATNGNNLDESIRSEVFNEVIDQINHDFPTLFFRVRMKPTDNAFGSGLRHRLLRR